MPTPKTPTLASRESRSQSIVSAAYSLIVERGFEGFRIREAAERAGIHHATLLHYFPTKVALIQGVIKDIVSRIGRVPKGDLGVLPPRDILHNYFAHVLTQMRDVPEQFTVLNELLARAARDEKLREVLVTNDKNWQEFLVSLLELGVAEGTFRPDLEPQAVATLIMSTFKGFGFGLTLTPEQAQQSVAQLERWIVGESA